MATTDKHMISSQAVGLLAILAVSGSVALLTFGKRKFLCHVLGLSDTPTPSSPSPPSEKTPLVLPQRVKDPCADEKAPQPVFKKVRFAPDVVDPVGDGQVYRSKNKSACSKKGCADEQEHAERCQRGSRSICERCKRGHPSSCTDCPRQPKAQTSVKPKLPANRMVLYKEMQRYRSMVELDCRS